MAGLIRSYSLSPGSTNDSLGEHPHGLFHVMHCEWRLERQFIMWCAGEVLTSSRRLRQPLDEGRTSTTRPRGMAVDRSASTQI